MKNEVNRAFTAKKRIYNQPEVQVAQLALESMVLAGSPADTLGIHTDIEGEQW